MMELNREQIIQALEYCTGIKSVDSCANCPACLGCNDCVDFLREESLVLIKELLDERERCLDALSELSDNIGLLKEKARTEAVRKMQEKLREYFSYNSIALYREFTLREIVDQIAKEMLEENK